MYEFQQVDASNPDFLTLVQLLNGELAARDGEDHVFYAQLNGLEDIRQVIVAYDARTHAALACGAIKHYAIGCVEIKRMFVRPQARGKGLASQVLQALEAWAQSLGYAQTILETGTSLPEAIGLYQKQGYTQIPNYGQYAGIETSVCFTKQLHKSPSAT